MTLKDQCLVKDFFFKLFSCVIEFYVRFILNKYMQGFFSMVLYKLWTPGIKKASRFIYTKTMILLRII